MVINPFYYRLILAIISKKTIDFRNPGGVIPATLRILKLVMWNCIPVSMGSSRHQREVSERHFSEVWNTLMKIGSLPPIWYTFGFWTRSMLPSYPQFIEIACLIMCVSQSHYSLGSVPEFFDEIPLLMLKTPRCWRSKCWCVFLKTLCCSPLLGHLFRRWANYLQPLI